MHRLQGRRKCGVEGRLKEVTVARACRTRRLGWNSWRSHKACAQIWSLSQRRWEATEVFTPGWVRWWHYHSEFCLWSSDTGLLLLEFTKELQLLEHHAEKDEWRCVRRGLKTQLVSLTRCEGWASSNLARDASHLTATQWKLCLKLSHQRLLPA